MVARREKSSLESHRMKQAQVIYYLHKGTTMEQPHSIDVGYMECSGLLLKDFKRRLNEIRGRRMPDSFSWSYKRNYKDEFIWHDVSDNDVILPTEGREYIIKGCEILRADEEPEFQTEPTKPTTLLPDDEAVDDSRDICVYKSAPEPRKYESLDTKSLLLLQRDEGLRQHQSKSSRTSSASSRADKPLPDSRHRVLLPQDTFELSSSRSLREEQWTPRTRTRSLMQMLRCGGDVKVERNSYRTKAVLDEREGLSAFSSWMDSSKSWREKLVPLAFAPKTSTTTSSGNRISGTPKVATFGARSSRSLTRYRPRNSFSNSEYFDHGSYDIYPRAEKVKEVDMNRQSTARSSTESLQLDSDPYYLYKTRATYDRRSVEEENEEESSGMTVNSRIISKLVQANEMDKDPGVVEGVPTPNNYESRPRKSSLDWEKNLQEAVNMIIRPPSRHDQVVKVAL